MRLKIPPSYIRKKILAKIMLSIVLLEICTTSLFAATNGFLYFSDILKSQGIIERDYISANNISRLDALRISVGIGGWPTGCSAASSVTCDIPSIARTRGIAFAGLGDVNIGTITRANAIRLVLQARGIPVSTNPSGFSDVDDKITKIYI